MTWPEVRDLLTRTDMVIMPVASLEEHGHQGPIGTDFLNGLERAKLVAQKTDVLVAPILFPGNSPYHMAFPGTITLPAETIQLVYFQAAQSLIRHGFKRFLILNSHGGNQAISRYIVDRINQETAGIAVELGEAAEPFVKRSTRQEPREFDRHGGVNETSASLYLTPNLVNMSAARTAPLTLPPHLQKMLPEVVAGDPDGHARVPGRIVEGGRDRQGDLDQGDDRDRRVEPARPRRGVRRAGPRRHRELRQRRHRLHRALEAASAAGDEVRCRP